MIHSVLNTIGLAKSFKGFISIFSSKNYFFGSKFETNPDRKIKVAFNVIIKNVFLYSLVLNKFSQKLIFKLGDRSR